MSLYTVMHKNQPMFLVWKSKFSGIVDGCRWLGGPVITLVFLVAVVSLCTEVQFDENWSGTHLLWPFLKDIGTFLKSFDTPLSILAVFSPINLQIFIKFWPTFANPPPNCWPLLWTASKICICWLLRTQKATKDLLEMTWIQFFSTVDILLHFMVGSMGSKV